MVAYVKADIIELFNSSPLTMEGPNTRVNITKSQPPAEAARTAEQLRI
jgi:hypothetical protein